MDSRQLRTIASYRRVLEFLRSADIQPVPPLLTKMRTRLERSVHRMGELGADQYVAKRSPSVQATQLRTMRLRLRREQMLPLARIARPLVKFAPGTQAVLKVPHARTDSLTLASSAQAMAKALAPHTKLFVSAGHPRDVIARLRADADALAKAACASESSRKTLSLRTAQLRQEFRSAADAVTVIEGILMPWLFKDKVLENSWRVARRVHGKVGRRRGRTSRSPAANETIA